jgi:protein O-GlcNAc transferase
MDPMKRFVILTLLLVTAVGGAMTYRTASRRDEDFEAIEAYSGAIGLKPDSMIAHVRRAETYQRRGDLDAAARDLKTAVWLNPAAAGPSEELGDVRYAQRQFGEATDAYAESLRLDARPARVAYKLAMARYRTSNVGGALQAIDIALHRDERLADAYYLQGLCLRDLVRLNEAVRAFEQAIALAPGFVAAREELADLFQSLGRHPDELEQLQVLAALDRDRIERYVAVALAHARWSNDAQQPVSTRTGHADLAVLTLGSALERSPDNPSIYTALGRVWLDIAEQRNDRAALHKALEALERSGSSKAATSESLTSYGRVLLQLGRTAEAEDTLRQATDRSPAEAQAFLFYASAADRQGHAKAARQALIQYGALAGNDPGFADRAARIATLSLRVHDRESAAEWLKRGLEKDPQHAGLLAIQARLK